MRAKRFLVAVVLVVAPVLGYAQQPEPKLTDFLSDTDIGAGTVAAGTLVGLNGNATTPINTTQDLVLAVKPFTSGSSKAGYGLAITPARTAITPMPVRNYYNSNWWRLVGATTFSYAENGTNTPAGPYRSQAVSIDTTYFLNPAEDPIIAAAGGFLDCPKRIEAQNRVMQLLQQGKQAEANAQAAEVERAAKECTDSARGRVRWNASRLSLGYTIGWMRPDSEDGQRVSRGRWLTLGSLFGIGANGAAYLTAHRVMNQVDMATLKTTPAFRDSNLVGLRYTYGTPGKGDWRVLAEISNARSSSATASNLTFKHAIGIDRKLIDGLWLEFRIGRSLKTDGTSTQTTGLLTLHWAPTSTLFPAKNPS